VPHTCACAGVMTVPPYDPDPRRSRPYFEALRRLARDLESASDSRLSSSRWGMSEDFEAASRRGQHWSVSAASSSARRRFAP